MSGLDAIETALRDQPRKPPLERWQPALSGDIDIRIDRRGDWYHEGVRIGRQPLVNLFASILRRESDGDYYLVTPVEKWRIRVDDVPLVIVDMDVAGGAAQRILFRLNTGEPVVLDATHPLFLADGDSAQRLPTLRLDHGLTAKPTTALYYRLVEIGVPQGDELAVLSDGEWFSLGSIAE
jgi:hypothetical protein